MDKDLQLENDLADIIDHHMHVRNLYATALDDFCLAMGKIDALVDRNHWPADGWDYETCCGVVDDMRTYPRAKQLEDWAADELLERELG